MFNEMGRLTCSASLILVSLLSGCATQSPQFTTSTQAPPARNSLDHVRPPSALTATAPAPEHLLRAQVSEFFLALSTQDAERLSSVLAPDALVKEGPNDTFRPILPRGLGAEHSAEDMQLLSFELRYPDDAPYSVHAEVTGSTEVSGLWRFHLAQQAPHKIATIILPER